MTRVMLGTIPSLDLTASSRSLAFPDAVDGSITLRRDIIFLQF